MLKFIPDLRFYCSCFKFTMMIPLDGLVNTNSEFGQKIKFSIFDNFFNYAFHKVFVVATTNLSSYCNHFEWPDFWHAGVSWPPSELIRFWSSSVDFPHFNGIWLCETGQISNIFLKIQARNGLKFDMLMYPNHHQNWLDFGHGLSISPILVPFWFCETGQIWGFGDFLQNAWYEWLQIWPADVPRPPFQLITFWS